MSHSFNMFHEVLDRYTRLLEDSVRREDSQRNQIESLNQQVNELNDRVYSLTDQKFELERIVTGLRNELSDLDTSSPMYELRLENRGPNKIAVIKVVREITGQGLLEAKIFVESSEQLIGTYHQRKAHMYAERLHNIGATVLVQEVSKMQQAVEIADIHECERHTAE